jgi:hypothetical protein
MAQGKGRASGGRWTKAIFEVSAKPELGADELATKYRINNDKADVKEFAKLFAEAKSERKEGRSFYALRHVFETVAGESRDQVAVGHIMGHARNDMASVYRERISDERVRAVNDHIRRCLFGGKRIVTSAELQTQKITGDWRPSIWRKRPSATV